MIAAFLNGDLEEEIYLAPPQGLGILSTHVRRRLRNSLYGLKQSPRCYSKKFDAWLKSQGFKPNAADQCLHVQHQGGNTIMISIHVDDQLLV